MAGRSEHLSKVEQDVERTVLTTKVELNDGTSGYIFSRNPHRNESQMFTYNCHICSVPNLPGERCLYTHIGGRKHQTKLTMKPFNANLFRAPFQRSNKIVMQIAPGEPVPPGFENEVKAVSDIQSKIEKSKNMSFIGLEYLVELRFHEDKEHGYICVLCEKRGDPRTIMDHLTSYKHRLKYLEKHFPTVTREIAVYRYNREARDVLPHVIQKICEAIEDAYGRLAPSVYDNDEYEKNRMSCLQEIINDKHFSEKSGSTFLHVINPKEIDEWIEKNKADFLAAAKRSAAPLEFNAKRGRSSVERRRSLDSISSISSSSLDRSPQRGFEHRKKHLHDKPDDDVIYIRSHSRSLSPRSQTHQRRSRSRDFAARNRSRSPHTRTQSPGRQVIPTPRELSMQAEAIGAEKYKWEKYRCMVEIALKELEKQRLEYDKSPEKHPLYPDEWKIFWNRRYKELQAEKKDPSKYDFTPEWKEFWTKRMIELHEESIEKRKEEIRKSLNLPKDARERTSELKEKFNIKSTRKERLNSPPPSTSLRRDKVEKPYRFGRSRSREKSLKSSDSYKRSSYEREKSIERYDRIERDRREPDRRDRDRERERERERERDRDRERDRERDRDRHHRPTSRGSYHEDSPARYPREEREPSDYYAPNPYKWHANQPKSLYPSKYYGREMPASTIPKYEEQPEEEPENDDPLTVVTVLRLLSALEELLGPSLGPKIVELLAKALALEKVKANSADDLLLNEENCVLFETIKEKLKAQLMNDMVEKHRMKAVKRAIKNIAGVIHLASEKEKNKTPEEKEQEAQMKIKVAAETKPAAVVPETKPVAKTPEDEKREIAKKLAAALVAQGRVDVSKEELETLVNYYYEKRKAAKKEDETEAPNAASTSQTADATETVSVHSPSVKSETSEPPIDLTEEVNEPKREQDEGFDLPQDASSALESLTDADLQTLLQNFEDLSQEEQQHLHTYMKKLEASDPARVEKLRKYIDRSDLKEKMEKHAPVERIDTKNDLKSETRTKRKSDPYKDMFYDDTKSGNGNSAAIVDSDDDDYSYDDLCKAASKNIKEQQRELESKQRSPEVLSDSDSVNRHDQFILGGERGSHYDDLSNASRASGENSNPRAALNDCESIIANLMGSLQKNVQNRNLSDRNQMDATNNDAQMQRHQIQSNVPFYLQQQTQSSYTMSNAKTSNQMYANDFNLNGPNGHFSSSNQYSNAFGNQNQNQNYGNAQKRVNIISNIPLNIPAFAQQQHNQQQQQQQQPQALTNQQAALLAQFSQQQNRRQPW